MWPFVSRLVGGVSAGFPSAAEGYEDRALDLRTLLVPNPAATFFMRADGDAMRGEGIRDGAILVVDRSVKPAHRHIVVAQLDGQFIVRKLLMHAGGAPRLICASGRYQPIPIDADADTDLVIWGVVTAAITRYGST